MVLIFVMISSPVFGQDSEINRTMDKLTEFNIENIMIYEGVALMSSALLASENNNDIKPFAVLLTIDAIAKFVILGTEEGLNKKAWIITMGLGELALANYNFQNTSNQTQSDAFKNNLNP